MNERLKIRSRSKTLVAGLLLLMCGSRLSGAQAVSEDQVKAAYLYSFAKFVEWPAGTFTSPSDPIRLCILNSRSFQTQLNKIAGNKQIAGHPVLVIFVQDAKQARGCQELFIDSSQNQETPQVIDALRGTSVLTVGETNSFVEQGGIINFIMQGDHVQFQVNQKAALQAGLHMSSQLLSVARRVFK
jgi:hypothetical protein